MPAIGRLSINTAARLTAANTSVQLRHRILHQVPKGNYRPPNHSTSTARPPQIHFHSRRTLTSLRAQKNTNVPTHKNLPALILLSSLAGISIWTYSRRSSIHNDAPALHITPKSPLQPTESNNAPAWKGMIYPALDLTTATAKLRAEETSTRMNAIRETGATRLDAVRLPSNSPSEDEKSYGLANVGDKEDWRFWGVYDGHAGWATARLLRSYLTNYVARAVREAKLAAGIDSDTIEHAIKSGFLALDDEITTDAIRALTDTTPHAEAISRIAPARAGSCALLAVFDPTTSTLRVACTGDSRAVLGRATQQPNSDPTYTAEPLSTDQTGFNTNEITRLESAHPDEPGFIDKTSGRLLGLAVTRAFGDHRWKWPLTAIKTCQSGFYGTSPRPLYESPPYLTAEPEVTTTTVGKGDFLILASDGLWDHLSSEHAVECVELWIDKNRKRQGVGGWTGVKKDNVVAKVDTGAGTSGREKQQFSYEFKAAPEHFVVEDENVATHLVRNALGGSRRELFCSVMSIQAPDSRNVRDDITVQVVFFGDVLGKREM